MKAERGLSINNPNESWLESKGTWFTYVLLITIGHLVILSIPFFDTPTAWTLTNIFHNLVGWGFDPCSFCLFVAIISVEKICELFVIIEYIEYGRTLPVKSNRWCTCAIELAFLLIEAMSGSRRMLRFVGNCLKTWGSRSLQWFGTNSVVDTRLQSDTILRTLHIGRRKRMFTLNVCSVI